MGQMPEPGDKRIECVECGSTFVLSEGEQKWFEDKGFSTPKRCPDCRAIRREQRKADTPEEGQ